nr:conserved hypothetical protein [Serratia symbiotica]
MRAVRMLLAQCDGYKSEHAAILSIAPKIGCSPNTLQAGLRQHERNTGSGDAGFPPVNDCALKSLSVNCDVATTSCARLRRILPRRNSTTIG